MSNKKEFVRLTTGQVDIAGFAASLLSASAVRDRSILHLGKEKNAITKSNILGATTFLGGIIFTHLVANQLSNCNNNCVSCSGMNETELER